MEDLGLSCLKNPRLGTSYTPIPMVDLKDKKIPLSNVSSNNFKFASQMQCLCHDHFSYNTPSSNPLGAPLVPKSSQS